MKLYEKSAPFHNFRIETRLPALAAYSELMLVIAFIETFTKNPKNNNQENCDK